ncbi:TetR/AcrR family transcriptional regulator [Streptomyces xanthophaeus]|uniref:TetR/AcrR family transcriptional regulator n=1 Tax=Streptomyces xanthophaeus TaxID=67385 RepID=UPI00068F7A33|nr:TetR/AcrR family transcriptional regulator [Streptomyces xanthophaeus]WCD84559.1 putative HTH-type transcriptional regulator [Streptomyces xanthophaeus]WST20801.1 TetR/AcrR family transcriptional regulator [Streptomyces xanthophaeus]WST64213.1 TetR/AcrR family transcriptional regulator [Streptomyces xanthophaeus]
MPAMSRRERLRIETTAEIKAVALDQLSAGDVAGITLRGIAREMGMTAAALYGYFDTRDDLLAALAADTYNRLADQQEQARDALPQEATAARVLAVACTFREWARTRPAEFRLTYGDGSSGYATPADSVGVAARRCCMILLGLVDAAWPAAPEQLKRAEAEWSDFVPSLAALARESFPHLPPQALLACLRVWGRMYGPVALEVYGQFGPEANPRVLFRAEMDSALEMLGLQKP